MPADVAIADIGAGDGFLSARLAARGQRVIAVEDKPGALAEARKTLDPAGVECRLGDGLAPLRPGEVGCAVLAGLGGRSIIRILAAQPRLVRSLDCLVVQPMQHLDELSGWLAAAGYTETGRATATARGRLYTALRYSPPDK